MLSEMNDDPSVDRKFYKDLGVKQAKIGPQTKTEFGAQNQYDRVIYLSIGNFTWSKKKYTFGGQRGENKPSVAKNGIWAKK
jgi:hypothetical protein